MKIANLALISILAFTPHLASARGTGTHHEPVNSLKLEDPQFKPYFERTLIFGHAISSGLYNNVENNTYAWLLGNWYGENPGAVLVREYANREPLANISESFGLPMETGFEKMIRLLNHAPYIDDAGRPQSEWYQPWMSHRDIDLMTSLYEKATAIVSVDAFYMEVAFDTCHTWSNRSAEDIEAYMSNFIEKAHTDGKLTILANVPKEDWSKVGLLTKAVVHNDWNEECRQRFNTALNKTCTASQNCHILDMAGIVEDLNRTGQIQLVSGKVVKANVKVGRSGTVNRVRPDGINISPEASQFMAERMLKSVKTDFVTVHSAP